MRFSFNMFIAYCLWDKINDCHLTYIKNHSSRYGILLILLLFFYCSQNLNVTWNTNDPDFTICFQKTVLIWLPCAFLWLFTPLELFYIKKSINRNVPYGFVNVSKLILTGALIILSIVDLIVAIVNNDNDNVHAVDYYTPVIKIATFVSIIINPLHLSFIVLCNSFNEINLFTQGIVSGVVRSKSKIWLTNIWIAILILAVFVDLRHSTTSLSSA